MHTCVSRCKARWGWTTESPGCRFRDLVHTKQQEVWGTHNAEGEGGNLACWGWGVRGAEGLWGILLACCKTTPKPSCNQIHTIPHTCGRALTYVPVQHQHTLDACKRMGRQGRQGKSKRLISNQAPWSCINTSTRLMPASAWAAGQAGPKPRRCRKKQYSVHCHAIFQDLPTPFPHLTHTFSTPAPGRCCRCHVAAQVRLHLISNCPHLLSTPHSHIYPTPSHIFPTPGCCSAA